MVQQWKGRHKYYTMETQKKIEFLFKNAYFCVSAVMFCKQFLAYLVHIDRSAFL